MSATTKKKLCWNCDGNVPLKAEHCPYCSVYIEQTNDIEEDEDREEAQAPPYATRSSLRQTNNAAPAPPFALPKKDKAHHPSKSKPTQQKEPPANNPTSRIVTILALLAFGSIFALFGLVLFLFSENGVFILRWNGDHWPVYLIVGPVFLIFGWRLLNKLDDAVLQ